MIRIEHTQVAGMEAALRGMRNPLNSWDKADSHIPALCEECMRNGAPCAREDCTEYELLDDMCFMIGDNDMQLAKKLIASGRDHRKFLRMIVVWADITAPLYWWKEYDTYKVGTVANSCSTMHTIHKHPFTLDDFSFDRFSDGKDQRMTFEFTVLGVLEELRERYNQTGDKACWRSLIQLLPQSYNQRRTVMLNYEVLRSMYHARKAHKLAEWQDFCHWAEKLPYSELITMEIKTA